MSDALRTDSVEEVNKKIEEINEYIKSKDVNKYVHFATILLKESGHLIDKNKKELIAHNILCFINNDLFNHEKRAKNLFVIRSEKIFYGVFLIKIILEKCSEEISDKNRKIIIDMIQVASWRLERFGHLDASEELLLLLFRVIPNQETWLIRALHYVKHGRFGDAWRHDAYVASLGERGDSKGSLWDGRACDGLLVRNDHGIGDFLIFSRYIPLAAKRVSKVWVKTPVRFEKLVKCMNFPDNVIVFSGELPADVEYFIEVMMLPGALGLGDADVRPLSHQLNLPKDDVDLWRRVVRRSEKLHVGVIWGAVTQNGERDNRSIGFELVRCLWSNKEINVVCLQANQCKNDIMNESIPENFIDFGVFDLYNTALAMLSVDVVVVPCCGMAQLSGVLGKKTIVILGEHHSWVWPSDQDKCRWHESVTIFRQKTQGDWSDVLEKIDAYFKACTESSVN